MVYASRALYEFKFLQNLCVALRGQTAFSVIIWVAKNERTRSGERLHARVAMEEGLRSVAMC